MADNIKNLLRIAEQRGCNIVNGSKHIKVYSGNGKSMVVVAPSSSDKLSVQNVRRDFRKILNLEL